MSDSVQCYILCNIYVDRVGEKLELKHVLEGHQLGVVSVDMNLGGTCILFSKTALKKSYCYAPASTSASTCKMMVGQQMFKSLNFNIYVFFFMHFNFVYHTNKASYNKSFTKVTHPVTVARRVKNLC